jgi:hypothetical protein
MRGTPRRSNRSNRPAERGASLDPDGVAKAEFELGSDVCVIAAQPDDNDAGCCVCVVDENG